MLSHSPAPVQDFVPGRRFQVRHSVESPDFWIGYGGDNMGKSSCFVVKISIFGWGTSSFFVGEKW